MLPPQWIQRRIDEALASMDSSEINDRRRREFETFLAITNSKTALFRDIIIESGCIHLLFHTVIIKSPAMDVNPTFPLCPCVACPLMTFGLHMPPVLIFINHGAHSHYGSKRVCALELWQNMTLWSLIGMPSRPVWAASGILVAEFSTNVPKRMVFCRMKVSVR